MSKKSNEHKLKKFLENVPVSCNSGANQLAEIAKKQSSKALKNNKKLPTRQFQQKRNIHYGKK